MDEINFGAHRRRTQGRWRKGRSLYLLLAAGVASLALLAAGCGSDNGDDTSTADGGSGTSGSKVSASLYGSAIPFFSDIEEGLSGEASAQGFEYKSTFSGFNPQEQLDQVQTLLAQQPAGLLVSPLDPQTLTPIGTEAQANGTIVMTISGALSSDSAYTSAIGADLADLGKRKADSIVEALGGEGTVALINGPRGLPFVEEQRKTAMEVFDSEPGIEVVAEDFTDVSVNAGLDATQNILTRNPNVTSLYYSGDDQAVGGIQAIDERGISQDDIFVVGTDGLDPGVQAVQDGDLDFTTAECPVRIGAIAMQTMSAALAGEEVESFVKTPLIDLTPDNIDEVLASDEWQDCLTGEIGD